MKNNQKENIMKKLITALALTAALGLSIFAQPASAPADKNFKPGFGPGMGMENCDGGMGPMHKGMGEMEGKRDRERCGNDFEGRGQHFGPMMIENLDLSKEQMDKIHQIKVKFDKADIDLSAELKKLKIDKREAMMELNFDKAKEVTKKMAEVRTKTQMGNIDEMSELTKVLSKEQLEKFKDMHRNPGMMKHKMMNKDK